MSFKEKFNMYGRKNSGMMTATAVNNVSKPSPVKGKVALTNNIFKQRSASQPKNTAFTAIVGVKQPTTKHSANSKCYELK